MASIDDEIQLWYYTTAEGVLPSGGRFPWAAVGGGGGGTLAAPGVLIGAAAAVKGFRRAASRTLVTDRVDVQLQFQGLTSSPTWASGASGHVLSIDDGQRVLGVAIGNDLDLVAADGSRLFQIPDENMPGGWVEPKHYLLIKDGEASWELWVSGKLVFRLPYAAAPLSTGSVGAVAFGWADATALSSGSAYWDDIEVGINAPLPPRWLVDRLRTTLPIYLQDRWTGRHEAVLRATVGLAHQARDKIARVHTEFTGAVIPVQEAAFAGDRLPTADGWTVGGSGVVSIVRDRVRIAASTAPTYAKASFATPTTLDGVFYARARFILRESVTLDAWGRVGPFLLLRDGHRQISAILRHDLSNPRAIGWTLSDANPSSALGVTGDVVYRLDPESEALVELYVIGRDRVILFVNGDFVEDVPYSRFDEPAATFEARIGRDGSADLSCTVDITDAYAMVAYGDNSYRPLFLRRVAERLLFASGCERNDVLDAWMKHRHGVFAARGTDRVISEIRRVACDDRAELVVLRYPGNWYVGVTYPGITPVFINARGEITDVTAEYRLEHAPNFTPEALEKLIEWYLLPRSAREARYRASLVTDLTTDTETSLEGGNTHFEVRSVVGFAVGDSVTLRGDTSGTLLTLTYDAAADGAADTMVVNAAAGDVWADWGTVSPGQQGDEIVGTFEIGGLAADRLNAVTSGGSILLRGAHASVDVWAEVFGREDGTGLPISRRVHVVGTSDVPVTAAWDVVLGVICTPEAQDEVAVVDVTTDDDLYVIPEGSRTSGCYLFDPPRFAGPAQIEAVADAASTAHLLLWGVKEALVDSGYGLTLTGTTPVVTSTAWDSLRVIAAGYLPTARTVTFSGLFCDPEADIVFTSSSALDVQPGRVFVIRRTGVAEALAVTLLGTDPAFTDYSSDLYNDTWHVLGIQLFGEAVGTVTVTQSVEPAITLATFVPGNRTKGIDVRRIDSVGGVSAQLSDAQTTPRHIAVFGRGEDGAALVDTIRLDGTE